MVKNIYYFQILQMRKFRVFNFTNVGIKSFNFKTVMKELKLEESLNKKTKAAFGTSSTVTDKCEYLKNTYKLTYVVGKSFAEEGKNIVGYGIKQQEVDNFQILC